MDFLAYLINRCSLHRLYRKWCFHEKTYYLLNYLTLTITDPQIKNEYDIARTKNFDDSFRSILFVVTCNAIFRSLQVATNKNVPHEKIFYALQTLFFVLIWGIMRRCWKKHAIYMPYAYMLFINIITYISYDDVMPSFLQNPDKKTDEVKVLLTIVVVHCVDYNTFRASLIFSCLLVLPIQWIILKEQVKIKYDPYTLEPLANNNEYFESQFFLTLLYIFTTVYHQYLVQRDLIVITIEKQMIIRHQQ